MSHDRFTSVVSGSTSSQPLFQFLVQAVAEPATLSRVIEFFALNDIMPDIVRSRRFVGGNLVIDIRVRGLDDQRVNVLANKLRSCVCVYGVSVEVLAVGSYRDQLSRDDASPDQASPDQASPDQASPDQDSHMRAVA